MLRGYRSSTARNLRSPARRMVSRLTLLLLVLGGIALLGQGAGRGPAAVQRVSAQPVLTLTAAPAVVQVGQTVEFTGRLLASTPGAIAISSIIAFGDGEAGSPVATRDGIFARHTYTAPGSYTATLTVTDTSGRVGQATTTVTVTSAAQRLTVTLRAQPLTLRAGDLVDFLGQVVASNPGGVTTSVTLDFGDGQRVTALTTGAGFIAQHAYTRVGTYPARLTVSDSTGQTAQAAVTITVSARTVSWP